MDKFETFKPDEETIESWVDTFEARLLCHNIRTCEKKKHWCQALVGETGRNIIKNLPQDSTWDQVKSELYNVLGETSPRERAFDQLFNYKAGGKGLGEIATDIMSIASVATDDLDAQNRFGLKAFLSAVPPSISKELWWKHLGSVREALQEARFLQRVEELEGSNEKKKVLTLDLPSAPPSQKNLVEECLGQLQSKGIKGKWKERRSGNSRQGVCWCCGEQGHFMMQCPTVKRNRSAQGGAIPKKPGKRVRGRIGTFVGPISS